MAFSEDEERRIRERLQEAGRDSFSRFGLKRTRIEDLCRSAGIAKGSFYRFYESKEALCFELLEQEELSRDALLREGLGAAETPESFAGVLIEAFDAFERSAVAMRLLELDEFQVMVRRISTGIIREHQGRDQERMYELFGKDSRLGKRLAGEPEPLAALFRALFMLSLHREEIGEELFPEVRRTLFQAVVRGLWRGEEQE